MPAFFQGLLSLVGRLLLCGIFFLSAVGNKIPKFNEVVGYMEKAGVPAPQLLLPGAIAFLILGSISIVLGFRGRIGALLLFIFLALATYYFHAFWKLPEAQQQGEMINFMKNAALAGAMLFIMGNGTGAWSLDSVLRRRASGASPA